MSRRTSEKGRTRGPASGYRSHPFRRDCAGHGVARSAPCRSLFPAAHGASPVGRLDLSWSTLVLGLPARGGYRDRCAGALGDGEVDKLSGGAEHHQPRPVGAEKGWISHDETAMLLMARA